MYQYNFNIYEGKSGADCQTIVRADRRSPEEADHSLEASDRICGKRLKEAIPATGRSHGAMADRRATGDSQGALSPAASPGAGSI